MVFRPAAPRDLKTFPGPHRQAPPCLAAAEVEWVSLRPLPLAHVEGKDSGWEAGASMLGGCCAGDREGHRQGREALSGREVRTDLKAWGTVRLAPPPGVTCGMTAVPGVRWARAGTWAQGPSHGETEGQRVSGVSEREAWRVQEAEGQAAEDRALGPFPMPALEPLRVPTL